MKISFSDRKGRDQKLDTIVLMDEPEAYMHPELARRFMAKLYEITDKYQEERTIQIIIGTHSPFMLSDVLPGQITRLDIDKQTGNAIVMNGSEREYFGANIHSILADGFFLEYTLGEYSRNYLQNAYERLISYGKMEQLSADAAEDVQKMRVLVPHIGDSLIRKAFEIALERFEQ